MNIILYLATKYLKFKASDRGISTIAVIAFFTMVFSSAASVVILSAANGLHNNFMEKLMLKDNHITVFGQGKGIANYELLIEELKKIDGVTYVYPFYDGQALIKGRFGTKGVYLRGLPPEFFASDPDFNKQLLIEKGQFALTNFHAIVLGGYLTYDLLGSNPVGQLVDVMTMSEDLLQYKFRIEGTFSAGYADYDTTLGFISIQDAQEIFDGLGFAYGIGVKVKDPYNVEKYVYSVSKRLQETEVANTYRIDTWKDRNRNNLIALDKEKLLMQVILAFYFFVVFFNILSTMIALVLDKKQEIGILKAMGLKPTDTLFVFLSDGFLIGIFGNILGVILGLLITISLNDILRLVEKIIDLINNVAYYMVVWIKPIAPPGHFEFFNRSVYYISEFPIRIEYIDMVFVAAMSVLISTLAVIVPAWKAAKLRPVEVLRND